MLQRQHNDACDFLGSEKAGLALAIEADKCKWANGEWQNLLANHSLLLTTPQLFLDAVTHEFLELSQFNLLIVDDCQHSLGGKGDHPYAGILRLASGLPDLRIIGFYKVYPLSDRKCQRPERDNVNRRKRKRDNLQEDLEKIMRATKVLSVTEY